MDPRIETLNLLKKHNCRMVRITGTGHNMYKLPNGERFTLCSAHRNGSGDYRGAANNLAELRRLLGLRSLPKPAPVIRAKRLRGRPKRLAPQEIKLPRPRRAVLPSPPPGPPPEKIMAPKISAEALAQPTDAGSFAHVDYSSTAGSGPAQRKNGTRHEPSDRNGRGHSLPPEVIAQANKSLQETGDASSILRTPTEEVLALITGSSVDAVRQHKPPVNILDLDARYDQLRNNVDPSRFMLDGIMYLCKVTQDLRNQVAEMAAHLAKIGQQVARPPVQPEPVAVEPGQEPAIRRRRKSTSPKALRYKNFVRQFAKAHTGLTGSGAIVREAGKLWQLMGERERDAYLPAMAVTEEPEGTVVIDELPTSAGHVAEGAALN